MNNPFEALKSTPSKEDLAYDEWQGQFSCSEYDCKDGYANIARYFPKSKLLVWKCQYGHTSRIEDVDE